MQYHVYSLQVTTEVACAASMAVIFVTGGDFLDQAGNSEIEFDIFDSKELAGNQDWERDDG
jgi:hypothetical protein